ncbi:MAG TPA: hypothetical protein VLD58_11885 [Gemmatimonadales bacterium]|nr:hypothetical protein [Gemmatimonadales bacterium]
MSRSRFLLAAFLIPVVPLAAQTRPDSLLVYPGASVRIHAPSLGAGVYLGRFATARVRGTTCYGAAVILPGSEGSPSLILLKGVSRLEVDRRTNFDYAVLGLEPATEEDWLPIDLGQLRVQDSACAIKGKPAG